MDAAGRRTRMGGLFCVQKGLITEWMNTPVDPAVQPGESEWNLDVLEALFDFYFVQPELLKQKRAALDAKLNEAGKPKMK